MVSASSDDLVDGSSKSKDENGNAQPSFPERGAALHRACGRGSGLRAVMSRG